MISRINIWVLVVMLVGGGGAGFFLDPYYLTVGTEILVAILFSISFNIALGYGGMISFGHSLFYGLGGYTVAILLRDTSLGFSVAILIGMVLAGLSGAIVAFLTSRSREVYFAILMMAFSQLGYFVAFSWYSFTQGDNGISGFNVGNFFSDPRNFYWFSLILTTVWCGTLIKFVQSPFGLTLRAMRDHEERSKFVGLHPNWHKVVALTISAIGSGLAGAIFVGMSKMAHPFLLHWSMAAQPVLMALMGGINLFWGPALGAIVYKIAEVILGQITERWTIVIGVVLLTVALAAPGGLMGIFSNRSPRLMGWGGRTVDRDQKSE